MTAHLTTPRERRWPQGLAALAAAALVLALLLAVLALLGDRWPPPPDEPASRAAATDPAAEGDGPPPDRLMPAPATTAPQADGWSHSPQRLATLTADRPDSATGGTAIGGIGPAIDAEPAAPVRLVIPAIDVDPPVVPVGLLASGAMAVPDFGLAGWYEPGPLVGEPGPAVIAAHVSSTAGPDVFAGLVDLAPGDEIAVETASGGRHVFVAAASEQLPKEQLPTDRIWSDDDEPVLRLITCGGEFDAAARSHRDNVIVYAEQAP